MRVPSSGWRSRRCVDTDRSFYVSLGPLGRAACGVQRNGQDGPSAPASATLVRSALPRDAAGCVLPCFSVGCSSRVSTPPGSRSAVGTVIGMAQPSVSEASPGGLDCVLQRPGCNLRHRCKWVVHCPSPVPRHNDMVGRMHLLVQSIYGPSESVGTFLSSCSQYE